MRRERRAPRQEIGLVIDEESGATLQQQVRQRLLDAISRGILRPGRRLPSSRRLARQIGVSRNTVILAYDALISGGHLVTRARSGVFVPPRAPAARVATVRHGRRPVTDAETGSGESIGASFRAPPSWQRHPFAFLDGCFDSSILPSEEWREALRLTHSKRELVRWGCDSPELDDEALSEELRSVVLPDFGLEAAPREVLCMGSQRQALNAAIAALVTRATVVAVDRAVDRETRQRIAQIAAQTVELESLDADAVSERLPRGSVIVMGGRRVPGQAIPARRGAERLLEAAAAREFQIIECQAPPDLPGFRPPIPSLRALDGEGRVVLVAAPPAAISLGRPLGLLCAGADLIGHLRTQRRLDSSELSPAQQRAWAYFIRLGHYSASAKRAALTLQRRHTALRDALNHYLHKFVTIESPPGSSAYFVRINSGEDAALVSRAAADLGVLVEPFEGSREPSTLVMGVTSVPAERIRPGVERLAQLIRRRAPLSPAAPAGETRFLEGAQLTRAMAGKSLLYSTVYGEPCTIEVHADGRLVGRAGFSDEDRDTGRWWTEGNLWHRQWQSWAYGEIASFYTAVDGDQVRWFNAERVLVDTALVVSAPRTKARLRHASGRTPG